MNIVADEMRIGVWVLPLTPEQERKMNQLVNIVYYTGLAATVTLAGTLIRSKYRRR